MYAMLPDTIPEKYGLGRKTINCTVLRAREPFVLRMRTLAIKYPTPRANLPFQTRKIPHPAPDGGRWKLTLIGALCVYVCVSVLSFLANSMALHCTVLRVSELFVLRMRTLAIKYPTHGASLPFQTRKIPHPAPGGGGEAI